MTSVRLPKEFQLSSPALEQMVTGLLTYGNITHVGLPQMRLVDLEGDARVVSQRIQLPVPRDGPWTEFYSPEDLAWLKTATGELVNSILGEDERSRAESEADASFDQGSASEAESEITVKTAPQKRAGGTPPSGLSTVAGSGLGSPESVPKKKAGPGLLSEPITPAVAPAARSGSLTKSEIELAGQRAARFTAENSLAEPPRLPREGGGLREALQLPQNGSG